MAKIAIMGYGTVGSGVAEILDRNREIITERAGEAITVKKILDLREFPGDPSRPDDSKSHVHFPPI